MFPAKCPFLPGEVVVLGLSRSTGYNLIKRSHTRAAEARLEPDRNAIPAASRGAITPRSYPQVSPSLGKPPKPHDSVTQT